MRLRDIQPAISIIQNHPVVSDLRSHTYLSTYPEIVTFLQGADEIQASQFRQLALMVYGWMPRVLRIDLVHFPLAVQAANSALHASTQTYENTPIQHIANCLHSMVGASKLLHFINPNVFPIWDRKIQAFRGFSIGNYDMSNIMNYIEYVSNVHAIAGENGFIDFYNQFCAAHEIRLRMNNIDFYQVSHLRSIEASAFELAP